MSTVPTIDSQTGTGPKRALRFAAREVAWRHSTLPRVAQCGRARVTADAGVPVFLDGDVAHFGNLQTCASVHSCAVCAPRIRQQRATEIEAAVTAHLAGGGGVLFVTLTLRHYLGQGLASLLDLVATGWSTVLGSRGWREDRDELGIVGTIRALEVTYGENGWHPHLHVLVFTASQLTVGQVLTLEDGLYDRWCSAVARAGVAAPTRRDGIDVRPVLQSSDVGEALGDYLTKGDVGELPGLGAASEARTSPASRAELEAAPSPRAGGRRIGLEMARHDLKGGRRKGRTPWAILGSLVEWDDALGQVDPETGEVYGGVELQLWREYEQATFRRRALTWSRGLKARFAIAEVTDDEIVEEVIGGEIVATIQPDRWRMVIARRGAPSRILRAAESGGTLGVVRVLLELFGDREDLSSILLD